MEQSVKLSPPWVQIGRLLEGVFFKDDEVTVTNLYGDYETILTVKEVEKAKALAALLKCEYELGNITLKVTVKDETGTVITADHSQIENAKDLLELAQVGFNNNGLVIDIKDDYSESSFNPGVVLITKKAIIQFFNDNLIDYYNNANVIVSDAFNNLLHLDWEIQEGLILHASTELGRDV